MFDYGPDPEQEREGDHVKQHIFLSLVGLALLILDDYFRRPEISVLRILTYVVISGGGLLGPRVRKMDRAARIRVAAYAAAGVGFLLSGLYMASLLVWSIGLALVVVAWLAPRWYSESAGPTAPGPDAH